MPAPGHGAAPQLSEPDPSEDLSVAPLRPRALGDAWPQPPPERDRQRQWLPDQLAAAATFQPSAPRPTPAPRQRRVRTLASGQGGVRLLFGRWRRRRAAGRGYPHRPVASWNMETRARSIAALPLRLCWRRWVGRARASARLERFISHADARDRARGIALRPAALRRWHWWAEWRVACQQLVLSHRTSLFLTRALRAIAATASSAGVLQAMAGLASDRSAWRAAARLLRRWRTSASFRLTLCDAVQRSTSARRSACLERWRLFSRLSARLSIAEGAPRQRVRLAAVRRAVWAWWRAASRLAALADRRRLGVGDTLHGWLSSALSPAARRFHLQSAMRCSIRLWRCSASAQAVQAQRIGDGSRRLSLRRLHLAAQRTRREHRMGATAARTGAAGGLRRAWARWWRGEPLARGYHSRLLRHTRWQVGGGWVWPAAAPGPSGGGAGGVMAPSLGAAHGRVLLQHQGQPGGGWFWGQGVDSGAGRPWRAVDVWADGTQRQAFSFWRGLVRSGHLLSRLDEWTKRRRQSAEWARWVRQLTIARAVAQQARLRATAAARLAAVAVLRRCVGRWRRECVRAAAHRLQLWPAPPSRVHAPRGRVQYSCPPHQLPQPPPRSPSAEMLRRVASGAVVADASNSPAAAAAACTGGAPAARPDSAPPCTDAGECGVCGAGQGLPPHWPGGSSAVPEPVVLLPRPRAGVGVATLKSARPSCPVPAPAAAASPPARCSLVAAGCSATALMGTEEALLLLAQKGAYAFGTGSEAQRIQFEARWGARWEMYRRLRQLRRAVHRGRLSRAQSAAQRTAAERWRGSEAGGRRLRRVGALAAWRRRASEHLRLALASVHASWRAGLLAFAKWHSTAADRQEHPTAPHAPNCTRALPPSQPPLRAAPCTGLSPRGGAGRTRDAPSRHPLRAVRLDLPCAWRP